ncbi:MAG: SWF/SNF helicase family protein, partial [Geothrix sp.]|nr:SWF/SNF helicase family protein [Geothrix sp.]
EPLFKERQVFPCAVAFSPDSHPQFAAFQQALIAAIAPRLKQAVRRHKYGEVLAFISLLKRSVSTANACLQTLTVIRDRYAEMASRGEAEAESRRQRLKTLREYQKRLERFGALSFEEEQDQAFLEAEDMAADLLVDGLEEFAGKIEEIQRTQRRQREQGKRIQTTRDALDALVAMAQDALSEDPKLSALLREIQAIRKDKAKANILVYTEYTDSQEAVLAYLREALAKGELQGEVQAISGSDSEATRTAITERFKTHDGIVLVSTDATSEGLNLHARCHHLVHVELPYNPNRLEQRNGRIDRYGQKEVPVVRYLYLAGSFEERLLMRLVAKYERQRLRLTFVPNTLGGLTTDDAQTVRLLEGLAEEENCLFKVAPREIRLIEEEPEDTTTPAYQELLSEVERAMTGFEKTAKSNAWLGDAGLNAEAVLSADAERARQEGASLSDVDLLKFVCAALEADAQPGAVNRGADGIIELRLPPSWDHGLKDLPGYDASGPTLLLTSDRAKNSDDRERQLGYLGRAHPVVRRALSRVRNIRFGETGAWLDRRVSALATSMDQPALLCTFLGAIESPRGHEFERVLAVQVERDGRCTVFDHPDHWLKLVDAGKAISPKDLWERHFVAWGEAWSGQAQNTAKDAFVRIAEPWYAEHARLNKDEYGEVDKWLRTRVEAICGPVQQAQSGLFEEAAELPRWATETAPLERLAAYAMDGKNPVAKRREANGIYRLYLMREKDLAAHQGARTLDPVPLGLLMLLPMSEGGR